MNSINKKKFTPINKILNAVLENNKLSHLYALEEIRKTWTSFDKTIAAHSSPVDYNFQEGTLKIKVDNTIWKKEFFENKDSLTVKIQNAFRTINIKRIEII